MKKYILVLSFILVGFTLRSQVPQNDNPGDTLAISTVISFEQPSPYIKIHPATENLWQIGAPHKTFFSNAYTVPNAIVTDTTNGYPVNNHSWFDLFVGAFNLFSYPYNTFIDFHHKIDSDTLHDGGYIEVSWDHGQTFQNILTDTSSFLNFIVNPRWSFNGWGNTNLYDTTQKLYNGQCGYSGKSAGWVHSDIAWWMLPLDRVQFFPDTMILRFNFISDNIQHAREGWMIDQIRLYTMDVGSGIKNPRQGQSHSRIFPNPASDQIHIACDRIFAEIKVELINAMGICVERTSGKQCSALTLQRNALPAGIYLLSITMDNNILETRQIILRD